LIISDFQLFLHQDLSCYCVWYGKIILLKKFFFNKKKYLYTWSYKNFIFKFFATTNNIKRINVYSIVYYNFLGKILCFSFSKKQNHKFTMSALFLLW